MKWDALDISGSIPRNMSHAYSLNLHDDMIVDPPGDGVEEFEFALVNSIECVDPQLALSIFKHALYDAYGDENLDAQKALAANYLSKFKKGQSKTFKVKGRGKGRGGDA